MRAYGNQRLGIIEAKDPGSSEVSEGVGLLLVEEPGKPRFLQGEALRLEIARTQLRGFHAKNFEVPFVQIHGLLNKNMKK